MARSQIPFIVQDTAGNVVSGASISINVRGAGLATVYAVEATSNVTPIANPVTSTSLGAIPGWLEEGSYAVTVSGTGLTTFTKTVEIVRGDAVIGTTRLVDLGVTSGKIADLSITNAKIADGSIGTSKISDGTITGVKLVAGTVGTTQLTDTGVTSGKLAPDAVTQAKMADNSVGAAEIIDSNVTNIKLAAAAVSLAKMGVNSVDSPQILDNAVTAAKIAAAAKSLLMPTGLIAIWPSAVIPTGWLLCDGAAQSRSIYSALFAVIGTTYGVGDNSTTFNMPDFKDRAPVGKSSTIVLNERLGDKTITLVESQMPSHLHGLRTTNDGVFHAIAAYGGGNGTPEGMNVASSMGYNGGFLQAGPTGGNESHSNMQPYIGMNFIINTGRFA